MKLRPGAMVWIPCEVKGGPFTSERTVRVESISGPWIGFVDVQYLKDSTISSGRTFLRAIVVQVGKDHFIAQLPGHPVGTSRLFEGRPDNVTLAPVPA